jgi:hypothetical protein
MDSFKILLTFKLAKLRTKRIYTPYGEVVTGRRGEKSFSATVCRKNPEIGVRRLRFHPQKLNFIICRREWDEKGKIIFCKPQEFVEYFKENFGFNIGTDEILGYDVSERFLSTFRDAREGIAILNSMYLLYTYREFPEVFIHTKDTRTRLELEPDIPMLEEVKNMGYAYSHPKTKHPKVRMNYLNDNGREIARSVFEHKLKNCEREVEKVVDRIGRRKVFYIALGTYRKGEMSLPIREPVYEPFNEDSVKTILSKLHLMGNFPLKELSDVQDPEQLISRFLTSVVIYDSALELFEELEKLGFAIKVRQFSKWGVEMGDVFRAPPELAEYLMDVCYYEMDDETVRKFISGISGILLDSFDGDAGRRVLNEMLMGIDFDIGDVGGNMRIKSKTELAELISEVI